jgi:hypothetical protein
MPWENQPDDLPTRAELARDLLLYVMKDYADEVCASWLVNQEFYLWEAAHLGRFPHAKDETGARVGLCKRLADLATLAEGWWVRPDSVGREGHQEVFLTEEAFRPFYVAWRKAQRSER